MPNKRKARGRDRHAIMTHVIDEVERMGICKLPQTLDAETMDRIKRRYAVRDFGAGPVAVKDRSIKPVSKPRTVHVPSEGLCVRIGK